jgi:SAM-dependent methyltransferase
MAEQQPIKARYYPEIFDAADLQRAKEIILTNEGPGADTEARWAIETPYLMELMRQVFSLRSDTVVLDYGCGVGRMAKAMIDASGCSVIGLDISPNMRRLAGDYVHSDRFIAVSPGQYDIMVRAGLRVNTAIAVWVLQHCVAPYEDIARIRHSLVADGNAFVLNMPKRAVPAVLDDDSVSGGRFTWAHDGIDVAALLRTEFRVQAEGTPDKSRTPTMADVGIYWMDLRPREN